MNTLFLVQTDAAGDVTRVTTHANRRDAFTYVNQQCLARDRYHVVGDAQDLPREGGLTVALANHLGSRQAAGERSVLYSLLASRYQSQPHEVIAPPVVIQPSAKEKDMETQTAETAKPGKAAKAAKSTATKAAKPAKTTARGKGKPAGKVADFRQVKIGSARADILTLMDGTKTAEQIGKAVKPAVDAAKVGAHAFCLARDCGIGYEYGPNRELKALFPTGKTLADALKEPGAAKPAKVAKPAKAAKPAAAPKAAKKAAKVPAAAAQPAAA